MSQLYIAEEHDKNAAWTNAQDNWFVILLFIIILFLFFRGTEQQR